MLKLSPDARRFAIDTLVLTFLTSLPAAAVEFYLLRMPAEDVIGLRLFAAIVGSLTGGVYGQWRDFLVSRIAGEHGGYKKRMGADILANMSQMLLVYPAQLWMFGANGRQVSIGLAIALAGCVIVGPLTGIALEVFRAGSIRPHAVLKVLRRSPVQEAPLKDVA